jgi:hypothetical protein
LSAEPLRASDAEIVERKRAWELKRLATLTHNNDVIGFVKDVVPPSPKCLPKTTAMCTWTTYIGTKLSKFLLSVLFFHISKCNWFINVLLLLGVHGQFDV